MTQIQFIGGPFDGLRRDIFFPEHELLTVIALPVMTVTLLNPTLVVHDESSHVKRAFYELEGQAYRFWGISPAASSADVPNFGLQSPAGSEAPAGHPPCFPRPWRSSSGRLLD